MNPELPAWDAPRNCDYCGISFQPTRPQDKSQRFCSGNHRKDFFRYGAKMRIVAAIRRDFDREIAALVKRISALENKLSKPLDEHPKEVVTLQHEEVTQ
jgi:hypothetical protein